MPWVEGEPLPRSERLALLERWERDWSEGSDVVMAVLLDGEVVGGTGLHRRRGPHGLEIGYWVDRTHLGQGIARETASMLTTVALALEEISFVEIHHDRANIRSARIPERLGYAFVGESPDTQDAPGEIGVDCAWRMTREAWGAPRD
jgi:RimJ/RimL family protein N-acetyltransferase